MTMLMATDDMLVSTTDQSSAIPLVEDVYSHTYILKLVLNIIFGVLILFGNILTLLAIATNKPLRTPTNRLIASLSCADLLSAVPLMTLRFLTFIEDAKVVRVLIMVSVLCMTLSLGASLSTILAIAIDRYIAILHPFYYRKWITNSFVTRGCICYWLYNIIFYFSLIIVFYKNANIELLKVTPHPSAVLPGSVYYSTILWQIILCQVISIVLYVQIFRSINKHAEKRRCPGGVVSPDVKYEPPKDSKISRATRTTAMVMVALIMCWMPYTVISLFATEERITHQPWFIYILDISMYILYSNSFMNPIIYAFRSQEFRKAYRCTLTCDTGPRARIASQLQTDIRLSRLSSVNSEANLVES